MFYYKDNELLYAMPTPLKGLKEITKEEYDIAIKALEPTEEELKAQKEAQLKALLRELYPDEYKEE